MVASNIVHLNIFSPGTDVITLTADDGDTVVSNLSSVEAVNITSNSNVDADLNATFSGNVATVEHRKQVALPYTIELYGE